jgi:DNA-binding transcriptional LysR family regulator
MDTELMRTFLEVNKTRHFGRAADNLYLTQAAVSARIKQLEDILCVSLFTRTRNNIQLSAEGERLVPHAETILISWSRARQEVALKLEQKHQLNIGTTAGLWSYVLQYKLSTIHKAMVDVALRAEAYTAEELLRLVQENVLDLVVLYEPANLPNLIAKPLGKLKLVLASSEKGIAPKVAIQSSYVYVDWGTTFGLFHAKRFEDAPPAILHTNMASIAETFIAEHKGSAYLPENLLAQRVDDKLHLVKGAPTFSRDLYAVFPANSPRLELLNDLVNYLQLQKPQ